MHRDRAQGLALGGLGLLHAYVLEKRHMMQQFAEEATIIEQTHIQMGRDIQAQARRRVLHLVFLCLPSPPLPNIDPSGGAP